MSHGNRSNGFRGAVSTARRQTAFGIFILLAIVFFGSAREAQAYTDPGSGVLIWQMLIAGFVGAMFYFRRFVSWIKGRKQDPALEAAMLAESEQTELTRSEK
jgi:hypothetical protein